MVDIYTIADGDTNWGDRVRANFTALSTAIDALNGAYTKPVDGIPLADLTAAVQASLAKADAAVPVGAVVASRVYVRGSDGAVTGLPWAANSAVASSLALRTSTGATFTGTPTDDAHATTKQYVDTGVATKYAKPVNGIDTNDLAQGVIDALNRANGAFHPSDIAGTSAIPIKNSAGNKSQLNYSYSGASDTIVVRGTGGTVAAGTPTLDGHAANKAYADTKYVKPSTGIPEADLSSDVQTKLNATGGGGSGGAVTSVAGRTGAVTLTKSDVGLANVDNTADADKPVSTATQTALNGKAASSHTHTASQISDGTSVFAQVGRAIAAGTGLTGGGTLVADRTIALSSASIASLAKADTAVQPAALATKAPQNLYGTYSARPAATSVGSGTIYYASDTMESYRSDASVWRVVGSGGNELAYAETNSGFSVTSGSGLADIPGTSIGFVQPERPVRIEFAALAQYVSTDAQAIVQLIETTTTTSTTMAQMFLGQSANSTDYSQGMFIRRITGTAGTTRTFKLAVTRRGITYNMPASTLYPTFIGAYSC